MKTGLGPGLGVSLYLSEPAAENLQLLRSCPERGVGAAFTSLHIPEDGNVGEQPRLLAELAATAVAFGLDLYADISPLTLRRLDLPGADDVTRICALADWGLSGVRFDDGFPIEVAAAVSRSMAVQLNASTLTGPEIARLHAAGANLGAIEALHNYYPRQDTGLGRTGYGRANERIRAAGLHVGAFVPGDGALRGPLHAGLPTCEDHRGADPVHAALDLWRGPWPGAGADTIYVGDVDLAAATWERWPWLAQGVAPMRWIPTTAEPAAQAVAATLTGMALSNRVDASDRVIRVRETRPMIGEPSTMAAAGLLLGPESASAGVPRPRGSVTVDNTSYGRYAGEVQITKVDLPADPRVCVLGTVCDLDLALLPLVGPGARLVLLAAPLAAGRGSGAPGPMRLPMG